jgi:phage-related protein (TIGR01555 family)
MGSVLNFARGIGDSLTNLVANLGTARDKSASSAYVLNLLTDAEITATYRAAWLSRKIVDIPAFDSVRAWRDWQAEDDQIEAIEAEEKRLNVKGRVLEARTKARLYGGAAIMLGTGDENLAEELDVERLGKDGLKYLTVLTRRQLTAGEINRDPQSEFYGRPSLYQLTTGTSAQVDIHPSRLVIFHGNAQPDDEFAQGNHGWGDSVLQSTFDAIKQADATAANIASMVFEAKVDIIRVPNFMANLADPAYRAKLIERYTLAATAKGINGTLMLDKEEEYETKSANFSTLPDVLDRFMQIASGAADIPMTRLFGMSPAGMSATGESDLRNYYDRLSSMQELEMGPAMHRMDECLIRSALGNRDKDIYYTWAPLWGMSEKEKAEVFKTKADGARALAGTGTSPALMPLEALSDALVNTFIEDGSLPGLEAAIDEYGKLSEQEEDETDIEAALLAPANQNDPAVQQRERLAATDAAPRTLYVQRKVKNAADIIAWAKGQGFETTLPADDLHVTIVYSRSPVDWMKVGESWSPELKIAAGGPRLMEQFGEATVLLFTASELRWRHEAAKEAGASWDHDEYQPHVTISYGFKGDLSKVQPYQGEIVLGPELFAEVKEDWGKGLKEE